MSNGRYRYITHTREIYFGIGVGVGYSGNGVLLTAVVIMCAGFGNPEESLSGFPNDGTWEVKREGLNKRW